MPRRTDMQAKIRALREFLARERRMPGYHEMLTVFDYRSKNAVHGLLRRLRDAGYVTLSGGKAAPTGKLLGGVRLLGAVQAGFPSPAEEELIDTLSMDEFLIRRPEATFMLTVTGDSMRDAGIHPGDLILVERGTAPKSNDIVVAQVDGEWTLKYFVKDRGGIRLEPANKAYTTIRPRESFSIGGVVRTVIRKYP
jgi:SOS regulatory protein LexA